MTQLAGLDRVTALWRARVGTAAARAGVFLFVLALLLAAHVARRGTLPSRATAALSVASCCVFLVVRFFQQRRDLGRPYWVLRRLVTPGDAAVGQRALRALGLFESSERPEFVGSRELAGYHWQRVAAAVESDGVRRHVERRARRWRWASRALLLAVVGLVAVEPYRIIEGCDVFLARDGRAPLPLPWLELRSVTVRPPAYLRQAERFVFSTRGEQQPVNSVVTVRGIPARRGRTLVLTDGAVEVAFVDDGSGAQVAHWTLERDTQLFVAARFGDVLIPENDVFPFRAEADLAPEVEIAHTPRQVELATIDRIEVDYAAADDHGLRQIDLVLRTAAREERRTLARLDGETRYYAAGSALLPNDPIFRSFLPVKITIEARDNDPSMVRWGSSQAINVAPLEVGKGEALRFQALHTAADGVIDWFAARQASATPPVATAAAEALFDAVRQRYMGLTLPKRYAAFLGGQSLQLRRLGRPGSSLRAAEDVVLSVDAALRALGYQDAQNVSKRLGDVAEEIATAAEVLAQAEPQTNASERLEAARGVLTLGLGNLGVLGALGEDLAGVGRADLARIERLSALSSWRDVERAARHLAARLRRPEPSFGSSGGGGGQAGPVESGARGGDSSSDESEQLERFDQFFQELADLVREHGQLLQQAEDAVRTGQPGAGLGELAGAESKLAERAANLAHRGDRSDTPLPPAATQALAEAEKKMQNASRELAHGAASAGVESQRQAQQFLEDASRDPTGATSPPHDPPPSRNDDAASQAPRSDAAGTGHTPDKNGDVPNPSNNDAAKGFRERVLKGLQQKAGRLGPAVRRYAEGLLQ